MYGPVKDFPDKKQLLCQLCNIDTEHKFIKRRDINHGKYKCNQCDNIVDCFLN